MTQDTFTHLTAFLQSLERGKIHYILQSCRDEAIMVVVTVPGERWEVELLAYGLSRSRTIYQLMARYTE